MGDLEPNKRDRKEYLHQYYLAHKDIKYTCEICNLQFFLIHKHKHIKTLKHRYNQLLLEQSKNKPKNNETNPQ